MHARHLLKTSCEHHSNAFDSGQDCMQDQRCGALGCAPCAHVEHNRVPERVGAQVRALTGALQPAYWQALIVVSLLYFARFDASFITLRAKLVPPAARTLKPLNRKIVVC